MTRLSRITLTAAGIAGMVIAGSGISMASSARAGAPFTVHRSWGTFTLNSKVAAKVKAHQPINYVFSYQASGIALFSQQYLDGFNSGCKDGQKVYPISCTAIAPVQTDPNAQIAEIQTKLSAGQIDCLSIEPATSNGFTSIANQLMDKGIPVFTVGVTSNGHEFTNFTQIPLKEGAVAATTVLDYMKSYHLHFKYFAVSGGDTSQFWAQGRMTGFERTIKAAIPNAVFYDTPGSAINTSYDPATTYDKAKAFILGHPQLQVFQNSDIGAEHIDRAIVDTGNKGKMYTVGWNVSKANLAYIDNRVQIATMDQKWAEQAAFGAKACAEFLAHGKILPNSQVLLPVTQKQVCKALIKAGGICTTVAVARKALNKVLHGG